MAVELDYSHTAAGILGTHRETMLENQLLLRPRLGRSMLRGHHLPGSNFTYGQPSKEHGGGAAVALGGWSSGKATEDCPPATGRDYSGLDRAAVDAGLTNAPEQVHFRATNDIRRPVTVKEVSKKRIRRIPASTVFGISTRPSTPVFELLEHRYQDRWLEERRARDAKQNQERSGRRSACGQVTDTRASRLRAYRNPVNPGSPWQLPRFTRHATPTLQTFRTDVARSAAYRNFDSDSTSRRGAIGHGIYETAPN